MALTLNRETLRLLAEKKALPEEEKEPKEGTPLDSLTGHCQSVVGICPSDQVCPDDSHGHPCHSVAPARCD